MASLSLVILAAGMGSRYGGLKQMDPVGPNGEAVLDYSVYDAWKAGFDRVIFIIREDFAESFQDRYHAKFSSRLKVEYAFQKLDDLPSPYATPEGREKPWGTGHALRAARHLLGPSDGPFAVINADDFYGRDSFQKLAEFLKHDARKDGSSKTPSWCMVGFPLQSTLSDHGPVSRGICSLNPDGKTLLTVTEHTHLSPDPSGSVIDHPPGGDATVFSGQESVSMNCWGFTPPLMNELESQFVDFLKQRLHEPKSEFYLPFVVDAALQAGTVSVQVLTTQSTWFGITSREDKIKVQQEIQNLIHEGVYPASLWAEA